MKRKQSIGIITVIVAFVVIWGAQANVSLGAQQAATGEITGKVVFEGARPKLQEIYMNKDPECLRENQGRKVYVQDGAVNANGTLPNVFVYVKAGGSGQAAVPKTPVVLDQQGCIFVPHVLGVMVGQTLKVLNSDFTMHNVHVHSKINLQWNESQQPGGAAIYKKFAHPEIMIQVGCNEHPWMKAYIGVVSNPYYGVTGTTGTFTIKGVPPGEYTIEAWTATFGTQTETVRVRAHHTTTLDFTFKQ